MLAGPQDEVVVTQYQKAEKASLKVDSPPPEVVEATPEPVNENVCMLIIQANPLPHAA